MISVEDLLKAFALAYDTWLDPECERENPVPEYADLIRQAVSAENAKLRELGECATCEVLGYDDGIDEALDGAMIYTVPEWYLSCGHTVQGAERPCFCPTCGRKVVE